MLSPWVIVRSSSLWFPHKELLVVGVPGASLSAAAFGTLRQLLASRVLVLIQSEPILDTTLNTSWQTVIFRCTVHHVGNIRARRKRLISHSCQFLTVNCLVCRMGVRMLDGAKHRADTKLHRLHGCMVAWAWLRWSGAGRLFGAGPCGMGEATTFRVDVVWAGWPQQFALWTRWGCRVRAPGLQDGGVSVFRWDVGRVPSPGAGWQTHNENCWVGPGWKRFP